MKGKLDVDNIAIIEHMMYFKGITLWYSAICNVILVKNLNIWTKYTVKNTQD
jgi:hypothetical protein